MAVGGTTRVVVAALGANALIAVSKFVAASITGSGAMLSEALHSVADTANQGLLLFGMRRARQPVMLRSLLPAAGNGGSVRLSAVWRGVRVTRTGQCRVAPLGPLPQPASSRSRRVARDCRPSSTGRTAPEADARPPERTPHGGRQPVLP